MDPNSLKNWSKIALSLIAFFLSFYAQASFIDQTIAVVDKNVITYRDVEKNYIVDKLLDQKKISDTTPLSSNFIILSQRDEIVQETLILQYMESFNGIENNFSSRVATLRKKIEQQFTPSALDNFLHKYSITSSDLDFILKRKVTKNQFMKNQLSFRLNLEETDYDRFYNENKSYLYRGKSFDQVKEKVIQDVQKRTVREEYKKWLENQIKRVNVLLLPIHPDLLSK